MKKIILSLLSGVLLISFVFAQDYDLCIDQCSLDYDSNLLCDITSCYDTCHDSEICEDEDACMESCDGDTDCIDECYLDSDCEESELSCLDSCDSSNESCVEEVENQYNSCVLQCENPGTDEPDTPVIPDNPGDNPGSDSGDSIGIFILGSFSSLFLQFTSIISEFIPYIVFISIGILIFTFGFIGIRWLVNWLGNKFNSVFSSKRD